MHIEQELRTVLDGIRTGKAFGDNGKVYKRPELEVNREVWVTVRNHLKSRGEFLRAPQPYYFDRVDLLSSTYHLVMAISRSWLAGRSARARGVIEWTYERSQRDVRGPGGGRGEGAGRGDGDCRADRSAIGVEGDFAGGRAQRRR